MADIVNERYTEAQALIEVRARKLNALVEQTKGKNFSKRAAFDKGVQHLADMIKNESEMLDIAIFDAPKTVVEQMRNLHLTTGNANQTVKQGMKSATDAMDCMLEVLTKMANEK